ncbi:hypothetical protein AB0J74_32010 [Asanoa sp. NPDC049573]|uniref:hypothetical protein n=1 Tax=Asanoa sp. NPDC049573 TaxID=3155396 RepID=UPI00344177DA
MFAFPTRTAARTALGLALVAVAGSAVACSASATPVASSLPEIVPTVGAEAPQATPLAAEPVTLSHGKPKPLTADEVRDATFTVPRWTGSDCPSGPVRFTDGRHVFGGPRDNIAFGPDVVIADADHDGDQDAIVLLRCRPGEFDLRQVVVVTRAGTNGVRLLGQVATEVPQPSALGRIHDIGALDRGRVQLLWKDAGAGGAIQFRFYGWTGNGFRQVAGPTRFGPDVAVSVAGPVRASRDEFGAWKGNLVVTVRNEGAHPVRYPLLNVRSTNGGVHSVIGARRGSEVHVVQDGASRIDQITLPDLAPGQSRTVTIQLFFGGDSDPVSGTVRMDIAGDVDNADNEAAYQVTTEG